MKKINKYILIISISLVISPAIALAADYYYEDSGSDTVSVKIKNSNASAQTNIYSVINTGNNTIENNGEETITTGDYQVSVSVKNEVDGEKQEPININIDSKDNPESAHIIKETENSKTEINIKVNKTNNNSGQSLENSNNENFDADATADATDDNKQNESLKASANIDKNIAKNASKNQDNMGKPVFRAALANIFFHFSNFFKKIFNIFNK